jgi:predicted Zn-dependent peptidase
MYKPTKLFSVFLSIILLSFVGYTTHAQTYKDLKFKPLEFKPPVVDRVELANGMILFLVEDHELPIVNISAMIRTGSVYEPADKVGLAELTGSVMRTGGTKSRTAEEINKDLEFMASTVETGIGEDSGSASLFTLKKNLDKSLEIFADVLMNPIFDKGRFELAKARALEAIRRRDDSPQGIANREFQKLIYGKAHPMSRTAEVETVNNITREDLIEFHKKYVHPNTIMLGVTGDFNKTEMIEKIEKVFVGWEKIKVDYPEVQSVDTSVKNAIGLFNKDINQTNLILGHIGTKITNPDYPAIRLLDEILGGGGFTSRLYKRVRNDEGLAYGIWSIFEAGLRDYGIFQIVLQTKTESTREAIDAVIEEVKRLTQTEVSDEELQMAKDQYMNSFVFRFDTRGKIVQRKMLYEYYGLPADFLETFRDKLMNVTKGDIFRVAKQYLHPDNLVIMAVGNQGKIEQGLTSIGPVTVLSKT